MIRQFDKIENLGVFANYKKPAVIEQFQKFNLIYGLNGSGKTTLSRFFFDLNTGEAPGFENLRYKISTDDGAFTHGQAYARKIRVFNSEYVDANIGELEGQLNPIFIIGEENKTLAKTVSDDTAALAKLIETVEEKTTARNKIALARGKIFTAVAQEISTHTSGTVIRTYRKPDAEKSYDNLKGVELFNAEDLAAATKSMKQQPLPQLQPVSFDLLRLDSIGEKSVELFEAVTALESTVGAVTSENAISIAIERLVQNPIIADWVEKGISIHKESVDGKCEYCLQKVPESRTQELALHFNDSDHELKLKLETILHDLRKVREALNTFKPPDRLALYPEFQPAFDKSVAKVFDLNPVLQKHLDKLTEVVSSKLTRRTESYKTVVSHLEMVPYLEALIEINDLIKLNNHETDKFDQRLKATREKIETHFLSSIKSAVDDVDKELAAIDGVIETCNKGEAASGVVGIATLEERIRENRFKISNSHQAAEQLSGKLESFLGRSDLRFEPEGEGYRIMRFDRAAKRLSEGEKTAITFLYFVVGLNDQDFDLKNGIVVIDDPISSLDSSSVYQAFSYLKLAVQEAHQIFLFTHNFEFLKLLLNWFQNMPKSAGARTYWMLHCSITGPSQREASLKPLDKVLRDNKNELTYLFKILRGFTSDGTISNAYHIPNLARKVLETFLEQHSSGTNLHQKLGNVVFDEAKKAALYKFTNDLSHPTMSGLDPALVGETQNNVKHLLEMIKSVAPVHFKSLEDALVSVQ